MSLDRVFYISTAAEGLTLEEVRRIVVRAQRRNRQLDVTGLLVFDRPHFAQVLEGRPEALDALLADIDRDPRHQDVRIVERRSIQQRRFDRWSMELLVSDALSRGMAGVRDGQLSADTMMDTLDVEAGAL